MEKKLTLQDKVFLAMKKQHKFQYEVALDIKISEPDFSKWLHRRKKLPPEKILELKAYLDLE